jgi:hypothetical protein
MAFDVSALTDYVKQEADKLVAATLLAPRTAKYISEGGNILTGVKSKEQIGALETDAVFQDGTACGFNSSGATAFSKRDVTVGAIKVQEALCLKTLEKKYTQKMLSVGATYNKPEDFSYAKFWAERKVAQTGVALEKAIWQGDTTSGNAQLNKFDGLLKIGSTVTNVNVGGLAIAPGGINKTNILSVLDAIFMAIPTQLLESEDFRIFTGYDILRLASIAGRDSKYFQYTTEIVNGEIVIPGTNVKLIGVGGLNATEHFIGSRLSNFYIGTDLESEETKFELWYSQDNKDLRYSNEFKYGVQFGNITEVVDFHTV